MSSTVRTRGLLRQGDVLLLPVSLEELPAQAAARAVTSIERELVLAEGEATGHAHVVRGRARLVRGGARRGSVPRSFLLVEEEGALFHEEHDPIPLAPGAYEVRRQREYEPQARTFSRWVSD